MLERSEKLRRRLERELLAQANKNTANEAKEKLNN
jgi:hypothetical protein